MTSLWVPLVVALVVTAVTTTAAAWRWQLVARRTGVRLELRAAMTAYYRSQWWNSILPGGVLGDVHRAARQARRSESRGRGLLSVALERGIGFAVQLTLSGLVLVVWFDLGVWVAAFAAAVLLGAFVAFRRRLAVSEWLGVLAASVVVVLGHAAVFVTVALSLDVKASLPVLAGAALVALGASTLPLGLAGWGPREGAAAWVFAHAGLGAMTGLTVSATYGVVALLATTPALLTFLPRRHKELVAHA